MNSNLNMDAPGPSRPRVSLSHKRPETHGPAESVHVFDEQAYDDDAAALPSYSEPRMPGRRSSIPDNRELEGDTGKRRDSGERLLGDGSAERGVMRGVARGTGGVGEDDEDENGYVKAGQIRQRRAEWWKNTLITAIFVCAWYGSATLLSIYNKWMFSPQYYNFPFPLFVTMWHMVVQFILAAAVRNIWSEKYRPKERPTRQDYVGKIFPTAASTAGDIGLSNLSLRTITLSLYTMCKSSALIFVLLFAFLFRLERFSLPLIGVITLISAGVFLMVFDTTSVNIPGIIMVFSASALSGLRWALTETLMKKKSMGLGNPFATIFWLAPLMALVLVPVSAGVEGWGRVFGNGHFDSGSWLFTIGVILLPGAIAFTMVASEYFIIHRAGILPLSVAGVFKEVTTISISAWIFGDQLTELNIVGVAIAVCGIALYAYHKYQKAMSSSTEAEPLILPETHTGRDQNPYSLTSSDPERQPASVPMSQLSSTSKDHMYPPLLPPNDRDSQEDRVQRRRDDFEGWNDNWSEDDEGEEEEEEVLKRRRERVGDSGAGHTGGSWGQWWDKEM